MSIKPENKIIVHVSVRSLVEFLLRSGDITRGRGGFAKRDAMLAGARIHRKIQRSRGPSYQSEVPLKTEINNPDHILLIEGRADGIYTDGDTVFIEEIKGTYSDPDSFEEAVPVHLAQARCYAAIYAGINGNEEMGICMTYAHLDSGKTRQFVSVESSGELSAWFAELVRKYSLWSSFTAGWKQTRDASLRDLEFPFTYREGQKGLVADIYRTIQRKKQVFVYAPTGVGKTVSAIYPSVRALGEGLADSVFYLTARTITRTVACETFDILRSSGMRAKTLVMTAREKICPGSCECGAETCQFARGHYDRINDVLYETLTEEDSWDRNVISGRAMSGRVCPYELQSDLAAFADAVICDYNYAFDPTARLRQFSGRSAAGNTPVFLIDEAHNLVERGREMFSADLYREEFMSVSRAISKKKSAPLKKLAGHVKKVSDILLEYRKAALEGRSPEDVSALVFPLMNLSAVLEDTLNDIQDEELADLLLGFYFRIQSFSAAADLMDESYIIYCIPSGRHDLFIRLYCTDPSENLQEVLDTGRSAVFFSATLVPVNYYRDLLSGRDDDYAIAVPSPFPAENRLILIGTDVSSRYTRRGTHEYSRIAAYIKKAVGARTGNYMVYFPSYRMMEDVMALCGEMEAELFIQRSDMAESDREDFLAAFGEDAGRSHVGFCVLGGIFAEGIDLTGDRLIGAVIVGTGIPQISHEKELLRDHYGRDGFAYAYRNPGMNKVLQAAGRVIRTEEDRGWILLLDDRFVNSDYRGCFPPSWNDRKTCTLDTVEDEIKNFWDRMSAG